MRTGRRTEDGAVAHGGELQLPGSGKRLEAAVVCLLGFRRKAAARKLSTGKVITDAIAADTALAATGVCACAVFEVFFLLAFHVYILR